MLTLLLGGARSGKSTLAVRLAADHPGDVVYVATSPRIEGDADLAARIAAHESERPADWCTVETELDLADAIADAGAAFVVVDCLTLWVNNLLHHGHHEDAVLAASTTVLRAVDARPAPTVAISNEVGLGIVPERTLARAYRDLLGRVNQQWATGADRALLVVAGRALPLLTIDEALA